MILVVYMDLKNSVDLNLGKQKVSGIKVLDTVSCRKFLCPNPFELHVRKILY